MAITVDHAAVGTVLTQAEYEAASGAAHSVSGEVAQATQAALEAETNEDTYAPPDLLKHHPGIAKMWGTVNQIGTQNLDANYNVDGIVDQGTGLTDFTIGDDFSSVNYATSVNSPQHRNSIVAVKTAAVLSVRIRDSNDVAIDSDETSVVAWGTQV